MDTQKPIRYIDLFCGLGAFHTAFRRYSSQFQCVLACDIDEGVRRIYKENYGLEPASDIRTLNPATMPDFELLCAGFPCQPFSIAGNGEGFKDAEKGNLFYDILKIIDAKQPPMCILENVKNLKTHDGGKTYTTIVTALTDRGYLVRSEVIDATDYGSPQARQRIFIVATKGTPFVFPKPVVATRPVSAILDTTVNRNDLDATRYTIVNKPTKAKVDASKPHVLADVFPKLNAKKQAVMDAAIAAAATARRRVEAATSEQERAAAVAAAEVAEAAAKPKGGRQGERIYSTAAVGVTVCASSGGPGAKTGLYKVGDTIRRLTVKETLGMFGFPSDYKFGETGDEDALFYLGNSIVVDIPFMLAPAVAAYFLA